MRPPEYCPKVLLVAGAVFACCLWKTGSLSFWSSNMRAKALIHFDLSIPSSSSSLSTLRRPSFNRTNTRLSRDAAHRRRNRGTLSRYMLLLYHRPRRPEADVVRAIQPVHVSSPLRDYGRILKFVIPSVGVDETLETAELLGIAGEIIRVRSLNDLSTTKNRSERIGRSRKDDAWRAFDVTSAVAGRNGGIVELYVYGKLTYRPNDHGPILLLNYSKVNSVRRHRRSPEEQEDQDRWEDKGRRRRNTCHRRSLYVNFSLIAYDKWVIAPDGYKAYQCSGKCSFPMGDHLSPTNHAIVQALMHGALQIGDDIRNKLVGKPCCVPTKLEPTSLLYMDDRGILTYEYSYEDMVVAECGCR